ncbi:YbdK family carboxylate-amine ligase [Pseudomonas nitroreducens]|uniref:Putative glutamate--cysteine ligase 2 n=1 Tax=Pseudomonas nitroreducens TaxID=46680 RepID=A0A5R9A609_PSENT|nr:YbdK family carboxylate-amine ligase [Pseudomonas nitroreducens]TLP73357.1 YbdK family carboxylate-amine ligase [Pseudomonas nitroreducens]
MPARPALPRFGIEEEFFLLEPASLDLARAVPLGFSHACRGVLGEEVAEEIFECQYELVSPVLRRIDEAAVFLDARRRSLRAVAQSHGLETLCVAAHPFTRLHLQSAAFRPRYRRLFEEEGAVARQSLLSGLHVHVEVRGIDRVQVMNRVLPWMPLLLVLSASSPFWGGGDTGLASYRQSLCGEWPRMGPPPSFTDESQWRRYAALLLQYGLMDEPGHTWWFLRPSVRYPTLELRISDASPRIDDALCIAGLFRLLVTQARGAAAVADPDWQRALLAENFWQARRHGCAGHFLLAEDQLVSARQWLERAKFAVGDWLDDEGERLFARAATIIAEGSSADRQRAVRKAALDEGKTEMAAWRAVVRHLQEENRRPPDCLD